MTCCIMQLLLVAGSCCLDDLILYGLCLQGNLLHWLMGPHCHDHFSVIYEGGNRTAVYQNTPGEPTALHSREVLS
jgi:hypothetical protein